MISLTQLSMMYGSKLLFAQVDLILNDQTRYALVGANGAGKSTFLRLLTGEEEAVDGNIFFPKDAKVGWLKQDQFRYEETPIVDVVIQGKPQLWEALQEKEKLCEKTEWDDATAYRFSELEEIINHYNGYSANAFAEKLLTGLGIAPAYHYQPLKVLSGGFKLRVLFAQTLFQEPDILLLDEPTNHLDIVSIEWLEKYLKNEFSGLLVFISHDVSFINRLAYFILDVDYGEIRQYSGNYQKFLAEKKLIEEQILSEKKGAEAKVAELQKFVDRFRAKASKARQAQSRMKMIEKIEMPDIKKSSRIAPAFNFKISRPSGKLTLNVQKLSKSFQQKQLFKNLTFQLNRGEKLAILGANGTGKSTLMKTLLDIVKADEGSIVWGHEAALSYFSQDHHEALNYSTTMMEWMRENISDKSEMEIRKMLGQVLFTQDDVHKNILSLSGGEAARVLLAKMMLEKHNVILLDEPTNHLDLEATEALADALKNYTGTVIFVSHNRDFVEAIANRIIYISENHTVKDFRGKYSEFVEKVGFL